MYVCMYIYLYICITRTGFEACEDRLRGTDHAPEVGGFGEVLFRQFSVVPQPRAVQR